MEYFEISFEDAFFDAILCLDTNLPDKETFLKLGKLPIIAADGAAIRLLKMGIVPNVIIGDLDTYYKHPLSQQISYSKIIQIKEQETNDFEKALKYAVENKFEKILIFGFHGGELEHTLNNWSVLKRYMGKLELCIYEDGRYAIPIDFSISLNVLKDEIISLIPQPKALITTKNLFWELNHEVLELGIRDGARNKAVSDEIFIEIHEGELLLFINARLPFAPKKILRIKIK
jgi:thiamine pyrophosphokinase